MTVARTAAYMAPSLIRRVAPALAVLASGRGSNFVAIADAVDRGDLPVRLALVLSDVADAPVLEEAARRGVAHGRRRSENARGPTAATLGSLRRLVLEELERHGVEYVASGRLHALFGGDCWSGTTAASSTSIRRCCRRFPDWMLNGKHWSTASTSPAARCIWWTTGMDTGPIIAQRAVHGATR